MSSKKQVELTRLSNQLAGLKTKYPKNVYDKLELEPEDILQHVRECIQAASTYNLSHIEYVNICWENPR